MTSQRKGRQVSRMGTAASPRAAAKAGAVDGLSSAARRSWAQVPGKFRKRAALPAPWAVIFGPLRRGRIDDLVVVGQFGQSVDARVATASGHSHYINGAAGLDHLHRLRALVDAVVVGVGTATKDDPQLTVRRVAGPSPARVVIDPRGRLHPNAKLLAGDGARRLVLTSDWASATFSPDIEVVRLPFASGQLAPAAMLAALEERGLRRILVEGGVDTVSRFLAARCLDRLHIMIAPIIIGSGPASVNLPPIAKLDAALRMAMRAHVLGDEVLLDCDLSDQRVPIGTAKRST
jgi:riboflavin-specific deaminase-like protein